MPTLLKDIMLSSFMTRSSILVMLSLRGIIDRPISEKEILVLSWLLIFWKI